MSLPKYRECKDSGVTWLGRVPNAWAISPLKCLAEFVNGYVFKPDSWSESGTPIIRIENLNGSRNFNFYDGEIDERHHVSKGDLLFGWSGNRGTSFGPFIWKVNGIHFLNQHIFKVKPRDCNYCWLYWCLRAVTAHVENQATGIIGMVHVTKGDLGAIKVPVPTPFEQQAIAVFLDRETAKIDTLIAEQEKLIALLNEKRQATICEAVTKGLTSNAPMTDSGWAWVGKIPVHWHIAKLGLYATVENGTTPSRAVPEYWEGGDIPWLASGEVNQLKITEASEFITAEALGSCSLRLLPAGTVVVGMIGQGKTRGMSAMLCISATINQNLAAICPGSRIEGLYILYVLHAVYEWLREAGRGGNQAAMNCEILSALRIPIPPLAEQRAIVEFIETEAAKLDLLKVEAARVVSLLKERRSALIDAAVTGQIDVRGAIRQAPAESLEALAA